MRRRAAVAMAAVMATALFATAPTSAEAAATITVVETNGRVVATVRTSPDGPGYDLAFDETRFGFTVLRGGMVVLRTSTSGPGMQVLQDGTWVRAPAAESPAIDHAVLPAPTTDQRGAPRGAAPDIGAFELSGACR